MSDFRPMSIEDIGTGIVHRRVTINGKLRLRGDDLTHADIASMATANRNALIENRFITVYPKSVKSARGPALAAIEGEFYVVARGVGEYAVIKGVQLLDKATKEAAIDFVAAEQAKIEKAPAKAAEAADKPPRKPRKKSGRRRRKVAPSATPNPPEAAGENGPIE